MAFGLPRSGTEMGEKRANHTAVARKLSRDKVKFADVELDIAQFNLPMAHGIQLACYESLINRYTPRMLHVRSVLC